MELTELVISLLKAKYKNVSYDGLYIGYDAANQRYNIFIHDIAYNGERLAWFQVDGRDQKRLVIYDDKNVSSWVLVTSMEDTYEHFDCHLIEWDGEYLTFIYHEKHKVYIGSVLGNRGRVFNYHGEMIKRVGNIIYCQEYLHQGIVRRVFMPSVKELAPVALKQCLSDGIVFDAIGYGNNLYNLGRSYIE